MSDFFVANLGPRSGGGANQANALSWSELLAGSDQRAKDEWTIPEAFLTILLAAVTCDGDLAAAEHEELMALVHRSRALKTLSANDLVDLNGKAIERLKRNEGSLREASAFLPEDMRSSVFAHALDLILADGEVNEAEADFLNALIFNLKLDRRDVERIADVIALKNRF